MNIIFHVFATLFVYASYTKVNARTVMRPEINHAACDATVDVTTNVYFGWPHKIACDLFLYDIEDSLYDLYDTLDYVDPETSIQCIISDDEGRVVFNTSTIFDNIVFSSPGFFIPDVNEQTIKNYKMFLLVPGTKICLQKSVHLNATVYEETTCEEFLQNQQKFVISSPVGNPKQYACSSADLQPVIYATVANANITIKWQRNCSNQLPAGVGVSDENNLKLSPVSYDHAGTYVCSITHNGMTRYVRSHDVCVQKPSIPNGVVPNITCSQDVYKSSIGSNATIDCAVNFGKGHMRRSNFVLFAGKSTALHRCTSNTKSSSKRRIYCRYTLNNEECFTRVPTTAQRQPSPFIVPLQLIIRNVQLEDFKSYIIQANTIYGDKTTIEVQLMEGIATS